MKNIIELSIILNTLLSSCSLAQSIDTLAQFAHVNERLFWDIISRNYTFSHDDIDTYKEDINFYHLSGNENINWTLDLIKKYEASLSKTYELQRNKGVQWNEPLILQFLSDDWLDWNQLYFNRQLTISKSLFEKEKNDFGTTDFLINETKDSLTFYYEHEYFTKERLFQDYLKNWHKESGGANVSAHNTLKPYFGKDISDVPIDTIIKYKEEFKWYEITRFANLRWSWLSFASLYPFLEERIIPENKYVFNRLFRPRLDSAYLFQLYGQFQNKERFYKLASGQDQYGTPPRVKVIAPSDAYFIRDVYAFGDLLPSTIDDFEYEIDHSPEGPKRFLDVLFLENDNGFPGFVCTEKAKVILESFNLPHHAFYPITIHLQSQWYGRDTTSYFLFVINNSSLLQNLQVESTKFRNDRDILQAFDYNIIDSLKITSLTQFRKFISPRYHYLNYKNRKLAQLHVELYFDVLTINGGSIHISKRLMNSLIAANISGLKYVKDYSLDWKFQTQGGGKVDIKNFEEYLDVMIVNTQRTTKLFDEAKEKQKRLAINWGNVSKVYEGIDESKLDSLELQLMKLEIKCDVVLPEEYRRYLLANQVPELGWEFREYTFLPIHEIRQVGKEWYGNIPQTFKAVLVAENGLGDYLGFLLHRDSDCQLSNTIYKFEHELGEVIESIQLE